MITFGPVPSRRLGRSLGINTIPAKVCSYSCTYCQVGFTTDREIARREFLRPEEVAGAVAAHVGQVRDRDEQIDYLTIVPDGEPTLDARLGETIRALRPLGIPIAVISNGSLTWDAAVRRDLAEADWVSLKVDAVDEILWKRVNRPHRDLRLAEILDGAIRFAEEFEGELCTETMLVAGVNDGEASVAALAEFLSGIPIAVAYLSVPTRPPASGDVRPPDESAVTRAYRLFERRLRVVELLVGYEGDTFAASGSRIGPARHHRGAPDAILGGRSAAGPNRRFVGRRRRASGRRRPDLRRSPRGALLRAQARPQMTADGPASHPRRVP
jgi:wyosine [tRNA(Phe)-imidazoG37] synthetase (radical SAM superfamily)